MRKLSWSWLWIGTLGLGGSPVTACTALPDNCDTHRTCDTGGTAGSSSGAGNDAGASAESGANSTGGSSGGKGGANASGTGAGGKAGTAGSAGSLGNSGEGGGGAGGVVCDTTKSPSEESCVVSDEFAVFVSPTGKDDNNGTQGAPLATLTKAVEVAAGEKIVLVCDATYDEHVSIAAGARIYGGFKCTDWSAEAAKPLFKPTTAGTALKIDTVPDDVVIESVGFEVGDAMGAGATALAAIVNASPKVTLRAVSLKAGKGNAGANGSLPNFDFPNATTLNGNPENTLTPGTGGAEKPCACQTGLMSIGGAGGPPASSGQNGSDGLPAHGTGGGQAGDHTKICNSGGGGGDGNNAPAAGPATGAAKVGSATSSGWQPTPGVDGAVGQPGQGGGGGASRDADGHGGGGGCGGCGGNGGTAGKGGGASIALVAIDSPVVFDSATLTTTDAGDGGKGAAGQAAKADIGAGGGVASSVHSCPGGNGGKGGDGGAGGGGAGGISVGIVWKGAIAPTVSVDTTVTNGKAGAKGIGGVPGTNDGIAGVAQKILPLN